MWYDASETKYLIPMKANGGGQKCHGIDIVGELEREEERTQKIMREMETETDLGVRTVMAEEKTKQPPIEFNGVVRHNSVLLGVLSAIC